MRSSEEDRRVFAVCLVVKLVFVVYVVITHGLLPDHVPDGAETLFDGSPSPSPILQPLLRWDSVHFANIALRGYERDYQFVFFPLWPLVLRTAAALCPRLSFSLSLSAAESAALCALLLNALLHALSAVVLNWLLQAMALSRREREIALAAHTLSPASVFFTATYSEALFSLCKLLGLYLSLCEDRVVLGALCLSAASLTRSNGVFSLCALLANSACVLWSHLRNNNKTEKDNASSLLSLIRTHFASLCVCAILIVAPSLLWNTHAHSTICCTASDAFTYLFNDVSVSVVDKRTCVAPDYCAEASPLSIYSLLQRRYWNVGLLRFYQWRQTPNLLLGLPPLVLSLRLLFSMRRDTDNGNLIRGESLMCALAAGRVVKPSERLRVSLCVDLLAHCVLIALFAHVNIASRMLASACPLFAVAVADAVLERKSLWSASAILYWAGYALLGAALHANNFPWT